MKIIYTDQVDPSTQTVWERDQVYNGMDCCMTAEILEALLPQLDETTQRTYNFSKALQGPVIEMRVRGVKVDMARRQEVISEIRETIDRLEDNLLHIVYDGIGLKNFNWRSNDDLKNLFYNALQIPTVTKGGRPVVDRNALEKIRQYRIAIPIVIHIIALKELGKKLGVLLTGIDSDGRIRTSYNIAGTSTGRFSSSMSEFGTGGNLQNVEESLRSILIADPGYKFAKFDAKSGESFVVGAIEWNLFGDAKYLQACESGDPHTAVARICWPDLGWTGNLKADKKIAEQPFYRHYTYRFMCKKLGHGSNYGGRPPTLAEQSHLPIGIVNTFQPLYYKNFPAHELWQEHVKSQIRKTGIITSLMGRRRHFWGRRNDEAVFREAIAYDPQSSLADIVNTALLNLWRMDLAKIMLQDHDALTFMYPEKDEDKIVPQIIDNLIVPVQLANGRVLRIPYDAKVGWNRGDFDYDHPEKNPEGLKDYFGHDDRKRRAEVSILDRKIR